MGSSAFTEPAGNGNPECHDPTRCCWSPVLHDARTAKQTGGNDYRGIQVALASPNLNGAQLFGPVPESGHSGAKTYFENSRKASCVACCKEWDCTLSELQSGKRGGPADCDDGTYNTSKIQHVVIRCNLCRAGSDQTNL